MGLTLTESLEDAKLVIQPLNKYKTINLIQRKDNNSTFVDYPIEIKISIYFDSNTGFGTGATKAGVISVLALSIPLLLSNPVTMVTLIRLI